MPKTKKPERPEGPVEVTAAEFEEAVKERVRQEGGNVKQAKPEIPTVRTVDASYQPSKAELEEDLRVGATFEEALKAVTRTVKVEYYEPGRKPR